MCHCNCNMTSRQRRLRIRTEYAQEITGHLHEAADQMAAEDSPQARVWAAGIRVLADLLSPQMTAKGQDLLPAYVQICNDLREKIQHRHEGFGPGDKLPSAKTMAKEYYTSTGPVRHALRILMHEDIVVILHGHGTYVVNEEVRARLMPRQPGRT